MNWQVTALHLAAWHCSPQVVKAILEKSNLEARDSFQRTPLHIAASYNPTIVPTLLEAGSDVNLLSRELIRGVVLGQFSPLW